ncbi:SPOR domain-containing protein [Pseudomonas atacamensis]|uniref:SPOR domain-containing protein n=1 Tax=Pseudomonas atacamensis TaxID=2565368 RepID=UPI00244A1236|nr:SPOR domain-containing protein [Pseudomonas atacamensis]MDH1260380.1 SPOR domain-containing protein [Pseudomonas atacamensis]
MRGLLVVGLAFAVAGCGGSDIDRARTAVADRLKDPDSAKFRNERQVADGGVCGEVNGKNGFGAYSGFAPFFAMKAPDGFDVVIDSSLSDPFVSKICGYTIASPQIEEPVQTKEIPGVQWAVQVASVSSDQTAEKLSQELIASGWKPYTTRREGKSRVLLGPFSTRSEANASMDELASKKALKGFVLRYSKPETSSK